MKKYEYKSELFNAIDKWKGFSQNKLDQFLKDYGDEGWELIEVTTTNSTAHIYYFKKEIL